MFKEEEKKTCSMQEKVQIEKIDKDFVFSRMCDFCSENVID